MPINQITPSIILKMTAAHVRISTDFTRSCGRGVREKTPRNREFGVQNVFESSQSGGWAMKQMRVFIANMLSHKAYPEKYFFRNIKVYNYNF
jgi:hypothetical protein